MKLKICLELSIKPKVLLIKRVDGITSLTALHNHNNNIKNNNNDNNNYYYCNDNVNYGNLAVDFPRSGSFCPLISSRMTFAKLVFGFVEGGKLQDPEKKPLEQGREPTTNSTHTLFLRAGNRTRTTVVEGDRSH